MWKSKFKKAVSICTFFAVLFSSVAGLSGLIAQSAQNSYTINQVQTVPTDRGDNLLVGKKATYSRRANGEEVEKAKTVANEAAYTDKKPSAAEPDSGNGGYIEYTADQGSAYIIYDLGGVCEISDVLVMSRTTNGDYYPKKYNVRIADTEEELFSDIACKISYRNHEKKVGQLFSYADNKPSGRYIAFEFPKTGIVRIGELGVYGTPSYSVTEQNTVPAGKTSLIAGKEYELFNHNGETLNQGTGSHNPKDFTDGNATTGGYIDYDFSKVRPCYVYDLGSVYNVEQILLISRLAAHKTAEYNIRLSYDKETLFTDSACIINYDNLKNPTQGQLFEFDADWQPAGRYLAFEIVKPCTEIGDNMVRIGELAVYGTQAYSVTEQNTVPTGKTSLIAGKEYELFNDNGETLNQGTGSHNPKDFTDGNATTGGYIDYDFSKVRPCYVYDLGSVYNVEQILLISRLAAHKTAEYNIRLSYDKETLFTDSACIINYDNLKNPTQGQLFEFDADWQPAGRYLAFEIVKPCTEIGDNMVRIGELAVYGTEVQKEEPVDYGCDVYMDLSNSFYHLYRNDLKEEWVPYLKYQALEGGGLRYNFSDPQPGVGSDVNYGQARGAYSESVSLEGVTLQFDRLEAEPSEDNTYFTITAAGLIGSKTDSYTGTGDQYSRGAISFNFDYTTGAVTVAAGGGKNAGSDLEISEYKEVAIAPNGILKLENLKGKPFKVFIHRSGDEEFEIRVTVDENTVSGKFTDSIIDTSGDYTWGIKNITNVYVGLAGGWDGAKLQSYSIDFIGISNVAPPQYEVIDLIDSIGIVTLDDEALINRTQQKYDNLSEYEKTRVVNVDALDAAQNSLLYLKQNEESIVDDTIEAIEKIGKVAKNSGAAVKEAERLYSRLSTAQRAKVKNADKLEKAIIEYYKLVAPEYEYDAVLYSPNDRLRRFNDEELEQQWQDRLTMEVTERGGLLFHWKDAIRDIRNGVGGILDAWQNIFHLNNLSFQVSNITPDTTIPETEGVGAKLNIQIGNAFDGYTTGKNLSLVLDTVAGEIRAYPGGGLVVSDEVLKYEPGNKDYMFEIRKTDDELYRLFVTVNGKNISGIIPSSVMGTLEPYMEYPDEPSRLRVELSPWVNNEKAIADNSKHTFSAELLSVQDSGHFAFEQIDDVITLFNTLPSKATANNIDDIQSIYEQYRALPYALRVYVTNYDKMSDLLAQMHKISAEDNLDWFDEADIPSNSGSNIGTATGDTSKIALFTVIAAVAAAVLVLAAIRLKRSKKDHDMGEDA